MLVCDLIPSHIHLFFGRDIRNVSTPLIDILPQLSIACLVPCIKHKAENRIKVHNVKLNTVETLKVKKQAAVFRFRV